MAFAISPVDAHLVQSLRRAIKDTSERGLTAAAKWSSELLLSIPSHKRTAAAAAATTTTTTTAALDESLADPADVSSSNFQTSTPAHSAIARHPRPSFDLASIATPRLGLDNRQDQGGSDSQPSSSLSEAELEDLEEDAFAAAKTCFDAKEFTRTVRLLEECKSTKARFLRIYCQFLISEKKALREWHKTDQKRHQPPVPVNTSLQELLALVQDASNDDPWLLFLKALFLSHLSRREDAIEAILLSLAVYPWNWSVWQLLIGQINDDAEFTALLPLIPLPESHPLVHMFRIRMMNELQHPSEAELEATEQLLKEDYFPSSVWLMSQKGSILYYMHDYARAEAQFERVLAKDPQRIDDIDVLSNILYVTENRLKLSRLAHEFLELEKDRPEICCLVGNHYSLRADHEKAIKYFQRAVQLDRTFLAAWTLMGHEFIELKNAHAAIESYRRAIDVSRKDYRAWYGLGQAYELLGMHQYSLHYYQQAGALRPYDVRVWQAQAQCYEELGRLREGIECYKHALLGADPHETTINSRLARLHHELGEVADAAAYHRRVVEVSLLESKPLHEFSKSSFYVARYQYMLPDGDLALAQEYLERVATGNTEESPQAVEMLKMVRAAKDARDLLNF